MTDSLHYHDLREGDRWVSRGRTVTETDVVNFAGMTGDYDPLHVDHDFASKSPFGQPVAHGLLGLALCAGLSSTSPTMKTTAFLGIRSWEFKQPIFVGDTLRAVTTVEQLLPPSPRHGRVIWRRRLVNQNDEVVQEGLFETLVAIDSAAARTATADETQHPPRPHLRMKRATDDVET